MIKFFIENIILVPVFPLIVFLILALSSVLQCQLSKKVIGIASLLSAFFGFLFSTIVALHCFYNADYNYESNFYWLNLSFIKLQFGFIVDNISTLMLVLVTSIVFAVLLYSVKYMDEDKSFQRYFLYLNFFAFSMLSLVLSPNLVQLYVFWELVGVSSYLLIGFWFKKKSASAAAKKAFIINRIGDIGLLAGIILILTLGSNLGSGISTEAVDFSKWGNLILLFKGMMPQAFFNFICILLLMGAVAKSAQFPLHVWLPDAMEAPTPISALIHAATMVASGVFLIFRLYPLFSQSEFVMTIIAILGIVTALLTSFIAVSQNDIKKVLAFSTSAQFGLMFAALGHEVYSGAGYYLVSHAYIKAMLFLCAGVLICYLNHNQDLRYMGGLKKSFPLLSQLYLFGCIALSGIFFSGFGAKEMILSSLWNNQNWVMMLLILIVGFLTSFYMFRTYFLVFEGDYRGKQDFATEKLDYMSLAIIILFIPVILLTFSTPCFSKFLPFDGMKDEIVFNWAITSLSVFVGILGAFVAMILFKMNRLLIKPYGFLRTFSFNKCYIDEIYDFCFVRLFKKISTILAFVDKNIIDGVVKILTFIVKIKAFIISKMQSGSFQAYIAYAIFFIGVSLAFCVFYFYYTIKEVIQ